MKTVHPYRQVAHLWANQSQETARTSNGSLYFKGRELWSYGSHFMIARHIGLGIVCFTLREYSTTTARQISQAKSACRHLTIVYANDPRDSIEANMRAARSAIIDALDASERKGIRKTTRAAHLARALQLAEQANEYYRLASANGEDTGAALPIDVNCDDMKAARETARKVDAERKAQHIRDLEASLAQWRRHEVIARTGLTNLPPALRLNADRDIVETSHGATVTAAEVRAFLPFVLNVRRSGKAYQAPTTFVRGVLGQTRNLAVTQVGAFPLREIRADGSVVIGCHDIAWSEVEAIARELGVSVE